MNIAVENGDSRWLCLVSAWPVPRSPMAADSTRARAAGIRLVYRYGKGGRGRTTEPVDISRLKEQEAALWEIAEPGIPSYMNVTPTIEPEHPESYVAVL